MSEYREHLQRSLFHAKACVRCIKKAGAALGRDLDDDPQSGGLVPPPGENDEAGSDWLDPILPAGEPEPNPQSGRFLRVVRS
jgi:hypothetical protein